MRPRADAVEHAAMTSPPTMVEPMGSIQMLSVAFDGNQFKGEILPELERLKRGGVVRIVDMLLVRKDSMGDVTVATSTDLDWSEAVSFGEFVGAMAALASGGIAEMERGAIAGAAEMADGHLFDADDVFRITRMLPANMSAAVVLFEHLWTKPLLNAIARAHGFALTNDWLRLEDIFQAGERAWAPGPGS
jgi:uncharacterized membrane protein